VSDATTWLPDAAGNPGNTSFVAAFRVAILVLFVVRIVLRLSFRELFPVSSTTGR
jgi:hypothetical protein